MASHFKILLSLFFVGALVSGVALFMPAQDEETVELRLGHVVDLEHPVHKTLVYMQEQLEEISGGQMSLKIYASGQLGSERDLIELMQIGSLAMAKVSVGPLEAFVPEMQVFSLPYVFDDNDHFWRVVKSDLGKELLLSPLRSDLRGLAFFDEGSRSFYTCPKPISSPAELAGMKIRTMKSQSAVSLMRALGASATPISFGELYTALQQGVVDGAENSPITYYKARHYEICRNFTLDEHNTIPGILMFSEIVWGKLNDQQRDWLQQAVDRTTPVQKALWASETEVALKALEDDGINIIYPEKSPFQESVAEFMQTFDGTPIGDILKRIEEQR
ncbi:TRAP transporter substrate-binding protein [Glaciecola sp. KUL10]|uniref:TRAP transporter substrate-binding protein n=1 Tax=Glaciecola sp. (strain KUL10) TaxID=2161813 RepID=UPI000D9E3A15|nr:TRAP transporter substrate-binding protein [Glaciecola sp. KUL10]GBL05689.1 TRAP transporter solute receptor, DctP family protein [Glaciecola sp. KUL10]